MAPPREVSVPTHRLRSSDPDELLDDLLKDDDDHSSISSLGVPPRDLLNDAAAAASAHRKLSESKSRSRNHRSHHQRPTSEQRLNRPPASTRGDDDDDEEDRAANALLSDPRQRYFRSSSFRGKPIRSTFDPDESDEDPTRGHMEQLSLGDNEPEVQILVTATTEDDDQSVEIIHLEDMSATTATTAPIQKPRANHPAAAPSQTNHTALQTSSANETHSRKQTTVDKKFDPRKTIKPTPTSAKPPMVDVKRSTTAKAVMFEKTIREPRLSHKAKTGKESLLFDKANKQVAKTTVEEPLLVDKTNKEPFSFKKRKEPVLANKSVKESLQEETASAKPLFVEKTQKQPLHVEKTRKEPLLVDKTKKEPFVVGKTRKEQLLVDKKTTKEPLLVEKKTTKEPLLVEKKTTKEPLLVGKKTKTKEPLLVEKTEKPESVTMDDDDGDHNSAGANTNELMDRVQERLLMQKLQDEITNLQDIIEQKNSEIEKLAGNLRRAVATKCDMVLAHTELERNHENNLSKRDEESKSLLKANFGLMEGHAEVEKELMNEVVRLKVVIEETRKGQVQEMHDWERMHKNEMLEKDYEIAKLHEDIRKITSMVPRAAPHNMGMALLSF